MLESYLLKDAPDIESVREMLLRFVVADEFDGKTSPELVRLCVGLLAEMHEAKDMDMPDEAVIAGEKDGYEAFYEGYVREMYGREVLEDDYEMCLCPPEHVCVPNTPRSMIVTAGKVQAQKSKAAMRAYERMMGAA